jgi:acetaldehyde dehydrogenase (acetylating)
MRYAILIVLGLVIGAVGTAMAMNALNHGPHITHSVMEVMDYHLDGLHATSVANRCTVSDTLPHLQAMRMVSNDIEPVFAATITDPKFKQRASDLRASLDALIATPPADCAAVGAAMKRVGGSCKACHQDFRS